MKAVKITVDVPAKYVGAHEDRIFLSVGQKLTGTVVLDGPGRPKACEVRWVDAHGRLLGRTPGKLDAYQRVIRYEFDLNQSFFPVHYIECSLDGQVQPMREKFFVAPTTDGWETIPAITWATYPFGDFYDKLQALGVNGIIAYGMAPFDHVVENAMRFYVDQATFWEISVYHRPFRLFWEPPTDYTGPVSPQSPGFGHNWKALHERYVRVRARCKKEGRMISRDDHYRKVFLRAYCPNDPGTRRDAGERFAAVVRQHKGFRPVFHNIADEAGITDQSKPFDFCYCHYCMDKFRLKLQKVYGSIGELNQQWGTDFKTWYDVYPLTTDETMDANMPAQKKSAPLNFAPWADHREFMDDTFSDFFAEMRRVGQSVDPIGYFSTGGCQWPDVFGGWDYCKLTRSVDALIPYNGGGNQELIRSVGGPVKNLSPFFGDDERQVRQMWFSIIHGDAGIVFWDADGDGGRFVVRPSGKIAKRGKTFGPAMREFRGGVGQQMQAWGRADDPIGMLYSQPSERAHWMLESMSERGEKDWFRSHDGVHTGNRLAWQQLIEDRQLQYRYVSYLDVDEGKGDLGRFKMLVLPESFALSARLVAAIKQFVLDGGTLVADGRVGRMTENCRQVESGLLDDLFGVVSAEKLELRTGGKLTAKRQAWLPATKDIATLNALDAGLRIAEGSGAEAAAGAGQTPAMIRRRVGKGWAVYLNVHVSPYEMSRHDVQKP
ncbi:MAG: beta-galactosidase trimerization domain-containing protein, partial [Phycisphaerae bacterium]|nr:beta-galactosidase trimerization domain-containing protein [Phycisphaerae bacterium]